MSSPVACPEAKLCDTDVAERAERRGGRTLEVDAKATRAALALAPSRSCVVTLPGAELWSSLLPATLAKIDEDGTHVDSATTSLAFFSTPLPPPLSLEAADGHPRRRDAEAEGPCAADASRSEGRFVAAAVPLAGPQ